MRKQAQTVTGKVISASSLAIRMRVDGALWTFNWSSDRGRPPAANQTITVTYEGITALSWKEA